MKVIFRDNGEELVRAEVIELPKVNDVVKIFGKQYKVKEIKHDLDISLKESGKKKVVETFILDLLQIPFWNLETGEVELYGKDESNNAH